MSKDKNAVTSIAELTKQKQVLEGELSTIEGQTQEAEILWEQCKKYWFGNGLEIICD